MRSSITVRHDATVQRAIEHNNEDAWSEVDCTEHGETRVAGAPMVTGTAWSFVAHSTIPAGALSELPLPRLYYRGDGEAVASDADYRRHAAVELAIRDLKEGSDSSTARRVSSTRTSPGPYSRRSPTTWCAGSRPSDSNSRVYSLPTPSVASSSRYPVGSHSPHDAAHSTCPRTGPGPPTGPPTGARASRTWLNLEPPSGWRVKGLTIREKGVPIR